MEHRRESEVKMYVCIGSINVMSCQMERGSE